MKNKLKKRVLAALGSVALLGGIVGSMLAVPAAANNGPTYVADNRTLNTWDTVNMAQSTKNIGRIWTDKSVSKDQIELKYGGLTGQTIKKTEDSDFLVALSALSSASSMTQVTDAPLDIVMVLDRSGSMGETLTPYLYTAVYAYDLSTNGNYYIKVNGEDQQVEYQTGNQTGWAYGSRYNRTYVEPKTSADDADTSHVQFYTRTDNASSTTKMQALKDAANAFIDATAASNRQISDTSRQHRISLVTYAGSASIAANWTYTVSNLKQTINRMNASGATYADDAMEEAQSLMQTARTDSSVRKVIIFFTDGEPNHGSGFWANIAAEAVNTARTLKASTTVNGTTVPGALIYSVGVLTGADSSVEPTGTTSTDKDFNHYLHAVSSNYPNASATSSGSGASSSWVLTPGTRDAGGNFYKTAADADELNTIFNDIFDEITTMPASPTVTESGNPQASGYITFTDKLGAYMEVKDANAIVFDDEVYTVKEKSESVDVAGTTNVQYVFTQSVTDVNQAHPGNYSLSNLVIQVKKGATPAEGDTVVVKVPSALLPLRHYDIDENGDLTITEAHPVRVLYSVGLKEGVEEAMTSGKLDNVEGLADYARTNARNGQVHFYSNYWSGDENGNTTASFLPASSNPFYFYTEQTLLYTDAACTTPVTRPQVGGTYYYKHEYYENTGGETMTPFASMEVKATANNISTLKADDTGAYYIPAGTPKYSMPTDTGFDYTKPAAGGASIGGSEIANVTDTAEYVAHPDGTSGGVATIYLGNNGRVSFNATGSLSVAKRVEAAEGLTPNPDAEFTFRVHLNGDNVDGLYAYTITKETLQAQDAGAGTVTQAEETDTYPQTGVLEISQGDVVAMYKGASIVNGKLEGNTADNTVKDGLTLKADEVITIHGIPVGVSYIVTEDQDEKFMPGGYSLTGTEHTFVNGNQVETVTSTEPTVTGTIANAVTNSVVYTNTYSVIEPVKYPATGTAFPVEKVVWKRNEDTGEVIRDVNEEWNEGWQFTFVVQPEDGAPEPENPIVKLYKANADENNVASSDGFGGITFNTPGTYRYTILEEAPPADGRLPGISYSNANFEVVIVVKDNGDGTLSVESSTLKQTKNFQGETVAENDQAVTVARFVNIYSVETASWAPRAFKYLTDTSGAGNQLKGKEYTFTLTYLPGESVNKTDATPPTFAPATNEATGNVIFASVPFDNADIGNTYVYKMEEVPGNLSGVSYDKTYYLVSVTIGEETVATGESAVTTSTLVTQVKPDGTETSFAPTALGLTFTNTYTPAPAEATVNVQKTFTGRPWLDEDKFTFTLAPSSSAFYLEYRDYEETNTDGSTQTVRKLTAVKGSGTTVNPAPSVIIEGPVADNTKAESFEKIVFNQAGTYVFNVTENIPSNKMGITYDSHVGTVTVTVTDVTGTGALTAAVSYNNASAITAADRAVTNAAVFTNTYTATSVSVPNLFQVAKNLEGREWQTGDEFLYRILIGNDTVLPNGVADIDYQTALNTTSDYPSATFSYSPTYRYTPGFTYGKDSEGNILYGPYVYYVYERLGTGDPENRDLLPGITYDRHVYKIEVYTSDMENGVYTGQLRVADIKYYKSSDTLSSDLSLPLKTLADMLDKKDDPENGKMTYTELSADSEYLKSTNNNQDGIPIKKVLFTNTYEAEEITIPGDTETALHGIKRFVGRDMTAGEKFTFVLEASQDYGQNVVFANGAATAEVTGLTDGNAARFEFGAITFKAAGTYVFNVSEVIPADADKAPNVTYDAHVGTITVTVTDNTNTGKLEATVVYNNDPALHHDTFTNLYYNVEDAKKVTNAEGNDINGQLVSAGQKLTYTIKWVNTATENGQPAPATVTITDTIPANTTFVSADNGGVLGKDEEGNDQVQWTISAAAGEQGSVSFQVTVNESPNGGDIVNYATVNGSETNVVTNYVPGKSGAEVVQDAAGNDEKIAMAEGSVQVGDILEFTITYKNLEKEAANIKITDTLNAGLTYVGMVGENAVIPSVNDQTLTWEIENVPNDGKDRSVTFQARVNEKALTVDAITNTATVWVNNVYEVDTNTITVPKPGTGELTITKTVTAPAGITAPADAEFSFKIELDDLTGSYPYTATGNQSGTVKSGDTVKLKAGQELTITGLPVGTTYTVSEINLPAGFTQTSAVDAEGTIAAESTAAFTNSFAPAVVTTPTVEKKIVDDFENGKVLDTWPGEYTFTFRMEPEIPDAPMPERAFFSFSNKKVIGDLTKIENPTGEIIYFDQNYEKIDSANFGSITYNKAGTYKYTITEWKYQDAEHRGFGISYSNAEYELTVVVSPNENGALEANTSLVQIFGDLNDLDEDVSVTDNVVVFKNEYKLENVSWSPAVSKTLVNSSGATLNPDAFVFTFKGEAVTPDAPIPTDGKNTTTIEGTGHARFADVIFDWEDVGKTFLYKFTEVATDPIPGVTYDSSVYYAKVEVSTKNEGEEAATAINVTYYKVDENGTETIDGQPVVQVTATGNDSVSAHFTNIYDPADTSVQIPVQKVLSGRDWQEGERFNFKLTPVDGAVMPEGKTELTLAVSNGEEANFSALTFDKVGIYRYHVVEEAGNAGGLTYDDTLYHVIVTVEDNNGVLAATVTYGPSHEDQSALTDALTFTNTYTAASAEVENAFPVSKTLIGRSWLSTDSFTFKLTAMGDAPMPAGTVEGVKTIIATSEAPVSFGTITYTVPGIYNYTIEEEDGGISGVSYDTNVYTATVTVKDDGKGELYVDSVTYADEENERVEVPLTFINTYSTGTTKASINVSKTLLGRTDWPATDYFKFRFQLTAVDGAPMHAVDTITISGDDTDASTPKTASFGEIEYTAAGTYEYTVTEIVPEDKDTHLIYDRSTDTVKVVVTDDNSGNLTAKVYYNGDENLEAAPFTNVYIEDGRPTKTVENSTKKIDGAMAMPGDVLTYTIHWVNSEGIDNATITIEDIIPAGTTYVADSATGHPTVSTNPQKLVWTIHNVSAGGHGEVTFQVEVNEDAPGEITNFATVNQAETNVTSTIVPKKTVDNTAPKIGEEFTYTITYKNPYDTKATVTITDELDPRLTFVSAQNGGEGVQDETTGIWTVTWTLTDVPAGKEGEVSFTAKLNESAVASDAAAAGLVPNDAAIILNNDPNLTYETNVVTVPEVATGSLSISKTVATENAPADAEFSFKIVLDGLTGSYPYTATGNQSSTVKSGDTVKLQAGETAIITGLPVGTQYTVTEIDIPAGFKLEKKTGYTGEIVANETAKANFTNTYAPDSTSAEIKVQKVIDGRNWQNGDSFTFTLTAATEGAPMPAQTEVIVTSANPESFDSISYTKAGTYKYTISEVAGNIPGMSYTTDAVTVTVTVTDNGQGALNADVSYDKANKAGTAALFTNIFQKTAADIRVLKHFNGWNVVPAGFNFTIAAHEDTPDAPMPADTSVNIKGADGTASFGDIAYHAPGVYKYTVCEDIPADTAKIYGVTYDQTVYTVTVTVANVEGKLQATVDYGVAGAAAAFVNEYEPPVKTVDKTTAGIGEEVTFTIRYTNTTGSPANITIEDTLDSGLDFVSAAASEGVSYTATYDEADHEVTWNITGVPAGASDVVTLVAKLNKTALTGDIQNKALVNGYETNIVTVEQVELTSLSLTKTVVLTEGQNTAVNTEQEFVFTVVLKNAGGVELSAADAFPYTIDGVAAGSISSGGTITLKHGQTAKILNLPMYTQYVITEAAYGGYSVQDSTALSGVINVADKTTTVTNVYSAEPVIVSLQANKTVTAPEGLDTTGLFSFSVYEDAACTGSPIATGVNTAGGKVTFSDLKFTAAGVYTYYIKENVNSEAEHITYDETIYKAVITVTDDGSGQLKAAVVYTTLDGAAISTEVPTFHNTYDEDYIVGGFSVEAEKILEVVSGSRTLKADEFAFGIFDENGNMVAGGTNDADGKVTFTPVTFSLMAADVVDAPKPSGIQVDHENLVPVYISLNDTAVLTAEELDLVAQGESANVELVLSNMGEMIGQEQIALVAASVPGETVTNALYLDLTLYKTVGDGQRTAVSAASEPVTMTFCGVSGYRLAQISGNEIQLLADLDGADNDTITIQTQTFGTFVLMQSEPETTEETVPETTEETVPETTEETVPETTEETVPETTEETVPETTEETVPETTEETVPETTEETVPETTAATDPVTIEETIPETQGETEPAMAAQVNYSVIYLSNTEETAAAVVSHEDIVIGVAEEPETAVLEPLTESVFHITVEQAGGDKDITVTEVGEFWYTVKELEGSLGGITYDKTIYKIKVNVVREGSQLICKPTYYKVAEDGSLTEATALVFTNRYEAKPVTEVAIEGYKRLEGRDLKDGEFTFVLTQGENQVAEVKNDAAGKFRFTVGPFDKVGTYTYTVTERKGSDPHVTYSDAAFTVTVVVTDDGNGQLRAEVKYPENTVINFTNVYVKPDPEPIYVAISGTKLLEGRDLTAGEFTFDLMDGERVVATAQNGADGKITFAVGPIAKPGTYTYTMVERKGTDPQITYSGAKFTVKITVVENAEIKLVASVEYPDGAPVFRNHYEEPAKTPVQVILEAKKVLEKRKLRESEFNFQVRNGRGDLLSTGRNDINGDVVFAPITFNEPGIYTLFISEVKGDQKHITYDDTVFTVTVTVTEGADNKLVAAVSYSGTPEFRNIYTKPPVEPDPDPSNPKTGDASSIPALLMICFSSAASLAVLLLNKKRWMGR